MKRALGVLVFLLSWIFLFVPTVLADTCACYDTAGGCSKITSTAANCQTDCGTTLSGQTKSLSTSVFGSGDTEASVVAACDAAAAAAADETVSDTSGTYLTPTLNVNIPDISFSKIAKIGNTLSINFIGEYVSGFYKYLISISVIIAVVMIMIGGAQYVAAAGSGDVGKAKERIRNAVTGFILLMFVVLLMQTVNPNLIFFKPLSIKQIDPEVYLVDNYDTAGSVSTSTLSEVAAINCPKSAGAASVYDIAMSFKGRVAYRFGGKGGAPPYTSETKKAPDGTPYKDFCPEDNVCLDCSGFANIIRACAGLAAVSGGTSQIFASAESVTSCAGTSLNGVPLQPGDFIGWKQGDLKKDGKTKQNFGHVYVYIGNGMVADSHGSGRPAGTAMGLYALQQICDKFNLRVARVSP